MANTVRQIISPDEKETICRELLTAVPEWKGYAADIDNCAAQCRMMPLWADIDEDEEISMRGFLALKETSPCAAEIYVMAIRGEYERRKVGKGLLTAMLSYARRQGYEYLQVKAVKTGVSPEFDSLNVFYQSLGFRELEVLPLWGEKLPCQIYIRNVNF